VILKWSYSDRSVDAVDDCAMLCYAMRCYAMQTGVIHNDTRCIICRQMYCMLVLHAAVVSLQCGTFKEEGPELL
jgi:hypothetical protein